MKLFSKLAIQFVVACITISCSKSKETPPLSKTTLLSQQPWILKAYSVVRLSDGFTQDGYGSMSACYKDDQYVFEADNTYEGNAGAAKCSPADPQVFQSGTWRFTNSETKLERVITSGSGVGTYEFSVISLTATELKINTEDGTYNHIITYSH
jgi:hypothetical protein